MGVKDYIVWSEIGSGFGKPGCTPPLIPRSTPTAPLSILERVKQSQSRKAGTNSRCPFSEVSVLESIVTVITF